MHQRTTHQSTDPSRRGSEERFKIGVVSVILCGSVIYDFYAHAEKSGLPAFELTHPPYAGIVLLFATLLIAVVGAVQCMPDLSRLYLGSVSRPTASHSC
jgi:hypothetical protein